MLREALAAVLERTAARFETALTRSELTTWARDACGDALSKSGPGRDSAEGRSSDLAVISSLAFTLFPDRGFEASDVANWPPSGDELDRARAWVEKAATQPKFPGDPLPLGLGRSLEYLFREADDASAAEDRLLRHVELRHAECLANWTGSLAGQDRSYERLGVAMLLASTSRRTGDLRFLNGALKMVDWFGATHIRSDRRTPARFHWRVLRTVMECLVGLRSIEQQ
jgi:hypothetical protein